MVYGLPAIGEGNWGQKVTDSIEAVKATADAAETPAGAQAKADAAETAAKAASIPLVQKAAASGVAPLDAGGLLPEANVPTRLTDSSLDAAYARKFQVNAGDYATIALALAAATAGDIVFVPNGTYSISAPLTVPAGVELRLAPGANISNTVETTSAVILSGAGSTLRGGKITSPAVFDTTTGAWTYAVVYITGEGAEVDGVTITNVPHLGIGIKEVNDVRITNCRIDGNYPEASWTGVETGHYGIALDVGTWVAATNSGSGVIIADNIIQECVQGISPVNHGTGTGYGCVITGNRFYGCHNHGIYSQIGVEANVITGNTFFRCQKPVVTTGTGHVIANNTMYNTLTGAQRDQAGISCRNATDCIIEGNSITGESTATNVAIQFDQTAGGVETSRNVIRGNVLNLTGTGGAPAIRVGDSTSTTCRDNVVEGNVIRGGGGAVSGAMVELIAASSSTGRGNVVRNNIVVATVSTHHIKADYQQYATITGNTVRNEYDAAGATTLIQVRLTSVTDSVIKDNVFVNTSSWGTNVTLQAVRENDAVCDRNILGPNVVRHDLTKLAASTEVVQNTPGNASLIGVAVGEYATASALGVLSGKVEVRDSKGAIKGYAPVYTTIT